MHLDNCLSEKEPIWSEARGAKLIHELQYFKKMIHKNCGGVGVKIGFTPAGSQRYKCKKCGKTFCENPKRGRPLIGDRPMTSAERKRRIRSINKKKSI